MAQRKSKADILRSEKYFDDAVYSAFLNLHKAAKKKSEYIWSTQKFSSFDSIWGEPMEQENNSVLDAASGVSGNKKFESESSNRTHYGVYNSQSINGMYESNQVEKKIPNNTRKNSLQNQKVFVNRKASLLQNFSNGNEGNGYKSESSIVVNKIPDVKMSKLKNFNQILYASEQERVELEEFKSNPNVDGKITSTEYARNREIFQKKASSSGMSILKAENQSHHSFRNAENTSRLPSFENFSVNIGSNAEENKGEKLYSGETEFQSSCIKSKLNHSDTPRKEKAIKKANRKRPLSSSVNVLYPEQKHSLEDQKFEKIHGSSKTLMSKTMLQVKIFTGDKVFDFTIEQSNFNRTTKRFPKLKEIFPEIDGDEKELSYSADAVKIILGYLCNLRYPKPDERTAIEVLAASKSWEMYQFHDEFKLEFSKTVSKNNVILAYGAAVYYGLEEICDVYKCMFSDDLPSSDRPYRPRKCYITVTTFIEPREFCIPLKTSASTLHDNFNRDIRNEIIFKAIAGSYVITGFHILLNTDNETDSNNLEFDYVVRNFKSSHEEELKVCKPLRRNNVIYLKRSLVVNEGETAEIVFESSIKPYLCYAIKDDILAGSCYENKFYLKMTSTYKVANSTYKRFFIGKLLYYPKA